MTGPWWRGAVIYQVYPRSFADGNGDGIGDLKGLLTRLDYIASLGVDAVWLSPIFPTPNKDFGYDVADYCAIAPEQGDMALFDHMVRECHARGLKVILDLVLAHTSDRHPWFIESRENPKGPKGDWYVWADAREDGSPPNNWLSVFGGAGWSWCPIRRQYWHHKFLREQPKLNLWNADCRAAVLDVFRFWIARGVDGFRLDVANSYLHDQALTDNPPLGLHDHRGKVRYHPPQMQRHVRDSNMPENAAVLRDIRTIVDESPHVFVFGEFSEEPELISLFAGTPDVLHSGYTFTFLEDRSFAPAKFRKHFEFLSEHPGVWPAITFSNHDTVRPVTRWGKDRDPVALGKLELALLMCLRGTALLYQGEELGLPEAHVPPDRVRDPVGLIYTPCSQGRDGCRTPMPWDADAPGMGFSEADAWLPLEEKHRALAVSRQDTAEGSILTYARQVIAARKKNQVLREGGIRFLELEAPLLGFRRGEGLEQVVCIFNLSGSTPAVVRVTQPGITLGLDLAGAGVKDGILDLPPLGAYVAVGMEVVS